jgi:hypothetical protein
MNYKDAARDMLEAYDGFMAGEELSEEKRELEKLVCGAGCFAAEAYNRAPDGANIGALPRSFLLALLDPTPPELDYLRADPAAGNAARDAAAQLTKIQNP